MIKSYQKLHLALHQQKIPHNCEWFQQKELEERQKDVVLSLPEWKTPILSKN